MVINYFVFVYRLYNMIDELDLYIHMLSDNDLELYQILFCSHKIYKYYHFYNLLHFFQSLYYPY